MIVFAHKMPDAWEALVTAMIRSGFLVDGNWPIHTERVARTRALSSAALSSSVWLVCKKRPEIRQSRLGQPCFGRDAAQHPRRALLELRFLTPPDQIASRYSLGCDCRSCLASTFRPVGVSIFSASSFSSAVRLPDPRPGPIRRFAEFATTPSLSSSALSVSIPCSNPLQIDERHQAERDPSFRLLELLEAVVM